MRVTVLLGVAGLEALFLLTVPLHRDWFDLAVYYGAVGHWVQDGWLLYDYRVPGTGYGFTYPPFAGVVMTPLTLVPWRGAVAAAFALNAVAAALILAWTAGPVIRCWMASPVIRERSEHPVIRGRSRRWTAWVVAGMLLVLLEPVRDTFSFGQVNLVLLALVLADARILAGRYRRFAGVGIGLAAAVKLTPALFIGYLLVTRRWRAAVTASAVAAGATLTVAWAAPEASRFYWTRALWDTGRIGEPAYVSNQSLQGVLARLADPAPPSRLAWALAVLLVLGVWAYRVARADDVTGFALTGAAACLVSPVTWVHHLVWLVPALAMLARTALAERPRRAVTATAIAVYVLLCSSVVWLWYDDASGVDGFVGASAYVWITLGLLVLLPAGEPRTRDSSSASGARSRREAVTGVDRGGALGGQRLQ